MDLAKIIDVRIEGLADICFDKFIDHSKEKRPAGEKLYLREGNIAVLPTANMRAFLFGEKSAGSARTFEGKQAKHYIRWGMGHVHIDPPLIDFLERDKPIVFDDFKKKFWILEESTCTKSSGGSITKQPIQSRPVLKLPWALKFQITLVENPQIDDAKLKQWFQKGGLVVGLGNYRPRFGRFRVVYWKSS